VKVGFVIRLEQSEIDDGLLVVATTVGGVEEVVILGVWGGDDDGLPIGVTTGIVVGAIVVVGVWGGGDDELSDGNGGVGTVEAGGKELIEVTSVDDPKLNVQTLFGQQVHGATRPKLS
jgi:hypothetical protein